MSFMELKGITKRFGDTVAVDALDLTVDRGEFLVLLGPSGCGKTTTLRMLAGLELQSEGRIILDDEDISDVLPERRDVAMVFQNLALYPHMSVWDNIAFYLQNAKVPKSQISERVRGVANMVEIGGLLHRHPGQLSGGQRQRVALARALVREPKLFLMDEPLAALDAKLRTTMRSEFKLLHRGLLEADRPGPGCFVYVTHDQEEALTLGTRVVVMNEGRVMQQDPPKRLYERPANRFTAGFIGSPPMNLIDGSIEERDERLQVDLGGLRVDLGPRTAWDLHGQRSVTWGIRPEEIRLVPPGPPSELDAESGQIRTVEFLGQNHLVILQVGPHQLKALVPASQDLQAGQHIGVCFPPERCHLFARDSGHRLTRDDLGDPADSTMPSAGDPGPLNAYTGEGP